MGIYSFSYIENTQVIFIVILKTYFEKLFPIQSTHWRVEITQSMPISYLSLEPGCEVGVDKNETDKSARIDNKR